MTDFPSYAYGTVSVDAGGTVVTGTDTLWSGVNARAGDDITIAGHTVIVVDVTDETHLTIDAWPYDAVTDGEYKITQRSPLRFVGAEARADVTRLLSTLEAKGLVWTLDAAYSSPNDLKPIPSAAEGQLFYQPTTGNYWVMQSGAWTPIASPYGLQAANALSEIAALGSAKQADARSNLVAAKSGANSDITALSGLTTPLSAAQGGTGDAGAAWALFYPTVSAGSGSFTSAAATGYWKGIGKTVFVYVKVTIGTNGSAGTYVSVLPPFSALRNASAVGRETSVSGDFLLANIQSGGNIIITKFDQSYAGGDGRVLELVIVYERT